MDTKKLEKKLSIAIRKVELLEKLIEVKSRQLYEEKEASEKLATFATHNPYPVIRIDKSGIILVSNTAANEYFNEEKLRGKKWVDYVDINKVEMSRIYGLGQHEYDVGDKVLLFSYRDVRELECVNIYGFDITERKNFEKELEDQRARQVHSQKMATLGEMAGGMAHELNTPLGMLSLSIDQIKTCFYKNKEDVFEEIILEMRNTTERMGSLINGFKTFSRESDVKDFSFISSKKLFNECIEISKMSLKNHGVKFDYPSEFDDVSIECNPTEVSQIIINLIQNARDAIQDLEDKWITLEVKIDESIKIRVTDSGKGIPLEIQDELFIPFFTTKDIGKGTGLGLSIIKGIVENHNGTIKIDNEFKNTSFYVDIPLIQNMGVIL